MDDPMTSQETTLSGDDNMEKFSLILTPETPEKTVISTSEVTTVLDVANESLVVFTADEGKINEDPGEMESVSGVIEVKRSYKRAKDNLDWTSDEEEFAGFEDCNGNVKDKYPKKKKVKDEPLSDMEDSENAYPFEIKTERMFEVKEEDESEKDSEKELDQELEKETDHELMEKGNEVRPPISEQLPISAPMKDSTPLAPASEDSAMKIKETDPKYRKPFEFGWKRELVYRAMLEDKRTKSDKGEVYYITPTGKKVRTKLEIQSYLQDGLDVNMFTFTKEALGMGPEEEIIRSAKPYTSSARRTNFLDLGEPDPSLGFGKRIIKPKMPKGASPPPMAKPKPATLNVKKTDPNIESDNKNTAKTAKTPKIKVNQNAGTPLMTGEDVSPPFKKRLLSRSTSKPQTPSGSPSHSTSTPIASSITPPKIAPLAVAGNDVFSGGNKKNTVVVMSASTHKIFATHFFNNVSIGYNVLLHTFQYLKVQELLRASCVCRMWNQVANHSSLWKTVRMKNSQVNDWSGLANTLKRNGTKHLDLRKMLIPGNSETTWQNFTDNIGKVVELESIDLCRCSAKVVESLLESNTGLRIINAITIKDDYLNFRNFDKLTKLTELRLKSLNTLLIDSLTGLQYLTHMKHLSLTSIRDLGNKDINVLVNLVNLETLELGECSEIISDFSINVLINLSNLERLRLEKGQEHCCTFDILDTVAKLPKLTQLELVNFDIKPAFDEHLKNCTNLKKLLIIPTYISQSATTNHMILNGVLSLADNLEQLTWVVTLELLRVTELYVDQCDGKRKEVKLPEDKIPVLKPVPGMSEEDKNVRKTIADVPQVEILPLHTVEKILSTEMPNTKYSILKVPYHATWRQNMIELA